MTALTTSPLIHRTPSSTTAHRVHVPTEKAEVGQGDFSARRVRTVTRVWAICFGLFVALSVALIVLAGTAVPL